MPLLNALVGDLKGLRYRSSLKIYLKNFYHVTSPEAFLSEGTNTFHNLISRCSLRHHNDKNRHRYHHIVIIMIRITITKQRVPFQQIPSWTSLEIRLVINAIYFRLWYCNCTIIGGKGRPGRPDGKYGFLSDPNSIWPNTQLGLGQIKLQSKVWHRMTTIDGWKSGRWKLNLLSSFFFRWLQLSTGCSSTSKLIKSD